MAELIFGTKEETKVTDDHGSTTTEQKTFRAGVISYPIRTRVRVMVKIKDQTHEFQEYTKFSDEIKANKKMFDPEWKWKQTQHGDYIEKSYTVLEY